MSTSSCAYSGKPGLPSIGREIRFSRFNSIFLTIRAGACVFEIVSGNQKSFKFSRLRYNAAGSDTVQISECSTVSAADMIVRMGVSVKTSFPSSRIKFLNNSFMQQDFQITIHSAQTNFGKL